MNYLRSKVNRYDYIEYLVFDGEVEGRNWSLVKRVYVDEVDGWYIDKFHYFLRIDMSEYSESYNRLFQSVDSKSRAGLMSIDFPGFKRIQFWMNNQSPGLWENGFNPNIWLEGEIKAYADEADVIRDIAQTGIDPENPRFALSMAENAVNRIRPLIEVLARLHPAGTPYVHWWGVEDQPKKPAPVRLGEFS